MFPIEKEAYIESVLNNSAMIVKNKNHSYILLGKGIAFSKKQGQFLRGEIQTEKVYQIIEYENKFKKIISTNKVNKDYIIDAVCTLLDTVNTKIDEQAMIAFCDHVAIMYDRVIKKEVIDNPFLYETKVLYKESYQLASLLSKELCKTNSLIIPENEIGYIALHLQNILDVEGTVSVEQLNVLVVEIKELLCEKYKFLIDNQDDNYARFISHLKFLVNRLTRNIAIKNDLKDIIRERYNDYFSIAFDIANLIQLNFNFHMGDDEISLIVLHLVRFIEI